MLLYKHTKDTNPLTYLSLKFRGSGYLLPLFKKYYVEKAYDK